ncbi:hypothetical protein CR513_07439, partial [Mucuna pruriens]
MVILNCVGHVAYQIDFTFFSFQYPQCLSCLLIKKIRENLTYEAQPDKIIKATQRQGHQFGLCGMEQSYRRLYMGAREQDEGAISVAFPRIKKILCCAFFKKFLELAKMTESTYIEAKNPKIASHHLVAIPYCPKGNKTPKIQWTTKFHGLMIQEPKKKSII